MFKSIDWKYEPKSFSAVSKDYIFKIEKKQIQDRAQEANKSILHLAEFSWMGKSIHCLRSCLILFSRTLFPETLILYFCKYTGL